MEFPVPVITRQIGLHKLREAVACLRNQPAERRWFVEEVKASETVRWLYHVVRLAGTRELALETVRVETTLTPINHSVSDIPEEPESDSVSDSLSPGT